MKEHLAFKPNYQKISQDFGTFKNLANSFGLSRQTLDHILYKKATLTFRSDKNRKIVNELLDKGYLSYTSSIQGVKNDLQESNQSL